MGVGSVLGFPFGEAFLLGAGGFGISWGLHHLGGSPQSRWTDVALEMRGLDFSWFPGHLGGCFLVGVFGLWLVSVGLLGLRSCWHVWLFAHSVGGAL